MRKTEEREKAMRNFVGIRKGVRTTEDAVETVGKLRRGSQDWLPRSAAGRKLRSKVVITDRSLTVAALMDLCGG